jgi:ribosome-binding protein aMBF1 (putative translation factor)
MPTCKICLRTFKKIRFNSSRICICGRCTNFLNECREVAQESYQAIGDLLKTGMLNRAHADIAPNVPLWRQERAKRTLENLDQEYRDALPDWTNRLLKDPENHTKIFKIARAHRRKLLHYDRPHGWG